MINHIHHINVLVTDIDQSLCQYRKILGDSPAILENLPARGVRTARFKVGDTWLVLVQPIADGVPARVLAATGEGVFLMSFAVSDLLGEQQALRDRGIGVVGAPRSGIAGWRVVDLDPAVQPGLTLQLCDDPHERLNKQSP